MDTKSASNEQIIRAIQKYNHMASVRLKALYNLCGISLINKYLKMSLEVETALTDKYLVKKFFNSFSFHNIIVPV